MERGLESTGLKDITRALGVTHAAFYHYFKSKNQIVFEAVEKAMLDLIATLQGSLEDAQPQAGQQLFQLVQAQVSHELTKCRVVPFIDLVLYGSLKSSCSLRAEQRTRLVDLRRDVLGFYSQTVIEGQRTGEFAEAPVSIVSSGILSLVSYNALWHRDDADLGENEIRDAIAEQALRAAGASRMPNSTAPLPQQADRPTPLPAVNTLQAV